jgi:hypothetical protein
MSPRKIRKKPAATRRSAKAKKDPLAYEMWLTREADRGPVEERAAAEDLLLKELQRPGPRKRSGSKKRKK